MKKNIIISVLATLVVVFIALLVLGLSENKKEVASEVDNFKSEIISGCVEEGANINYCQCSYDYLSTNYSKQEILQMGLKIQNNEMPDEIVEAASNCLELY